MFQHSKIFKKLYAVRVVIILLLLCTMFSCEENNNFEAINKNVKKKTLIKLELNGISFEHAHLEREMKIVLDEASFIYSDSIKIYCTYSDRTTENYLYKFIAKNKQQSTDSIIFVITPTTENLVFVYNNVKRALPVGLISNYNRIDVSQGLPTTLHIVFVEEKSQIF